MDFDFEFVLSPQKRTSSGFGQTAEEAARVASVEVRSYGVDSSKLKLSIEPIQIDGSKVLDFRDPKVENFFESRKMADGFLVRRAEPHSYTLPNILGHSAQSNGIEAIILRSEPDQVYNSGFNLHMMGKN